MHQGHRSFLLGSTLAALGVLGIACQVGNVDTNTPVNTGGSGGSAGAAGTAGTGGGSATCPGSFADAAGVVGPIFRHAYEDAKTGPISGYKGEFYYPGVSLYGELGLAGGGSTKIRFVHLAPTVAPADICVRKCTGNTLEIRMVSGTATDCNTKLDPGAADVQSSFVALASPDTGVGYATAVLTGETATGKAPVLIVAPDAIGVASAANFAVTNGLTQTGAVDFGMNVGGTFTAISSAVAAPGATASSFAVGTAAAGTGTPTFRATGGSTLASGTMVTTVNGQYYSAFIGGTSQGDANKAYIPKMIFCDNTESLLAGTASIRACAYQP